MYEPNEEKCKNYELCGGTVPPEMGVSYCMNCGSWFRFGFGWDSLNFKDCNKEECVLCNEEVDRMMEFPTNCGHWFCIECCKKILFWDETRYHISPVPYGCPPCPKGCDNPIRGRQCYCEEYDEIRDKWEKEQPDQYNWWNDNENLSIDIGEGQASSLSSRTCPLCRKKYVRE